jgi:uncharacterized membrane-anchored protein YhcB (DUF1043 family)
MSTEESTYSSWGVIAIVFLVVCVVGFVIVRFILDFVKWVNVKREDVDSLIIRSNGKLDEADSLQVQVESIINDADELITQFSGMYDSITHSKEDVVDEIEDVVDSVCDDAIKLYGNCACDYGNSFADKAKKKVCEVACKAC